MTHTTLINDSSIVSAILACSSAISSTSSIRCAIIVVRWMALESNFKLFCDVGYDNADADGYNCVEIDECLSNPCHADSACANNPGSYRCTCNDKYSTVVGNAPNKTVCNDIDECDYGLNNYNANAVCTINPCGYSCMCNNGFNSDGVQSLNFNARTTTNALMAFAAMTSTATTSKAHFPAPVKLATKMTTMSTMPVMSTSTVKSVPAILTTVSTMLLVLTSLI